MALDDAQLKALIVEKSVWLQNTVTGDKYMIIYGALGQGPGREAAHARASPATSRSASPPTRASSRCGTWEGTWRCRA